MDTAYKVLKIDELVRPGEVGGIERYSRVTFKTRKGVIKTIDIDEVDLTPEKAAPIIEKRAKEIDAIMSL